VHSKRQYFARVKPHQTVILTTRAPGAWHRERKNVHVGGAKINNCEKVKAAIVFESQFTHKSRQHHKEVTRDCFQQNISARSVVHKLLKIKDTHRPDEGFYATSTSLTVGTYGRECPEH